MKKILALFLFSAFALLEAQDEIIPLNGGLARTVALGGGPQNPYTKDYTDVFTNPAYALEYKDLLFSDIGYSFTQYSASGQYIGVTLAITDFALGIAIGKREGPMFSENSYNPSFTFSASDNMTAGASGRWGISVNEPKAPVQIFGAYKMEKLTLGAALYRSGWSSSGNITLIQKYEANQNQTGLKFGIIFEESPERIYEGSLLARLNRSSIDISPANPTANSYEANGYELALNVRGFIKLNEKIDIIPRGRLGYFTYKPEVTTTPASPFANEPNNYSKIEVEAGAAVNSKFEGGFVSVGLSVQYITLTNDITSPSGSVLLTEENSITWFDLPKINIGSEFEILSWLKGRLGYFKRLSTQTTTLGTTVLETSIGNEPGYVPNLGLSAASQQLSFGLGIAVQRVAIDGLVGERFLAAGPSILSGNVQDMFGVVSVSVRL